MNPLDRPDDKAVWGKLRFWVSGRLPQIFMEANHFPNRPKMKIFAMTRVIFRRSGLARPPKDIFQLTQPCRMILVYFINNPIITKIERKCIALNSFSYLCLLNEALACFEQKRASRY
jgi:hypothetical protein